MNVCKESVFKKVFDRWQKPLQHFLQSRGLDMAAAADQVQECFLRMWNNCGKVEVVKAQSYLFSIASRLQIDEYRKAQVRLKYTAQQSTNDTNRKDGQYILEEQEFKERLEHTINSMTESSRQVFVMNRFDSKTYKEIAEILEISVKAVEKRMSKALRHLLDNNINLKR